MSEFSTQSNRKSSKRGDTRTLLKFVEELSWLLTSYGDLDFKALGKLASESERVSQSSQNLTGYSNKRAPLAQLLVGTLPALLRDNSLFPSNEDIVEFASTTLGIEMVRWQKKSRYELIGHIVCNADLASEKSLKVLISILDGIMADKGDVRKKLAEQRRSGLSWNEVIQMIIENK